MNNRPPITQSLKAPKNVDPEGPSHIIRSEHSERSFQSNIPFNIKNINNSDLNSIKRGSCISGEQVRNIRGIFSTKSSKEIQQQLRERSFIWEKDGKKFICIDSQLFLERQKIEKNRNQNNILSNIDEVAMESIHQISDKLSVNSFDRFYADKQEQARLQSECMKVETSEGDVDCAQLKRQKQVFKEEEIVKQSNLSQMREKEQLTQKIYQKYKKYKQLYLNEYEKNKNLKSQLKTLFNKIRQSQQK